MTEVTEVKARVKLSRVEAFKVVGWINEQRKILERVKPTKEAVCEEIKNKLKIDINPIVLTKLCRESGTEIKTLFQIKPRGKVGRGNNQARLIATQLTYVIEQVKNLYDQCGVSFDVKKEINIPMLKAIASGKSSFTITDLTKETK